jgi:hypothetical protein
MFIDEKSSRKYDKTEFNSISKRSYMIIKLTSSQGCTDALTYANH